MLLSGRLDANEPANPDPRPAPAPLPLPPLAPISTGSSFLPYYPSPVFPDAFHRRPPRVWTVFVAYLIALVGGQLVGAAVLLGIVYAQHSRELESLEQFVDLVKDSATNPDVLLPSLLWMQVALFAIAVCGAWLSPLPFKKRLRLGPSTMPAYGYPLLMAGAISIGFLFQLIYESLHLPPSEIMKMTTDLMKNMTPWQVVASVLVIGASPAFGEEWLFRGYMQTRLSRRWGRWAAIAITACLFGIMHLNIPQGIFAALLGVYIGYLAEKTGSIRVGMACHFANNSTQVILGRYAANWNPGATAVAIVLAGAAVVLAGAILYMGWGLRQPPPQIEPPPQALPAPAVIGWPEGIQ